MIARLAAVFLLTATVDGLQVPTTPPQPAMERQPDLVPDDEMCRQMYFDENLERRNGVGNTDFAMQLWNEARGMAGLKPFPENEISKKRDFIKQFYFTPFPTVISEGASDCPNANNAFQFQEVWKAANDFVKTNVRWMCGGNFNGEYDFVEVPSETLGREKGNDMPVRFTMVRDPLPRFVSAYTETTWRSHIYRCSPVLQAEYNETLSPTELAREFLQAVLDADESVLRTERHGCIGLRHIFAQGGNLAAWSHSLVGKVEEFDEAWDKFSSQIGLLAHDKLNYDLGTHETSNDPYGRGEAMLNVLHADPKLQKAMQRLYAADYGCFNYQSEVSLFHWAADDVM